MNDKEWDELFAFEGDEMEMTIERVTIEKGRTFSPDAMNGLHDQLTAFIATRIMRRWDATGEPPTALTVHMKVSVG